jgi:spore coat polysaccharide biosynthesis protein SpsF
MNVAVLQARMTSTRLPGKVMMPVLGEPMIGRQIERLRRCARIDRLIVATSTEPSDDELARHCESLGVEVFRGALGDVLDRVCGALMGLENARTAIRLTADCPLTDWAVIDEVIAHHQATGADYTNNTMPERTYPHGLDVEAIRPDVLFRAWREATDPYEREHVTPFIYRRPEAFRLASVRRKPPLGELRWTVDLPEDLEFVREVYGRLYPANPAFDTDAIAALPRNSSGAPQ